MALKLPHPIPYQGSKRLLAPLIKQFIPEDIETFYEPFAGSAAITIFSAHYKLANRFILSDKLEAIIELWDVIINNPDKTALAYEKVWIGQQKADDTYYNAVRSRYNEHKDPVDLLYLICRCVKNAIRFNSKGNFTQSHDKRRLGMRPDKMRDAILSAASMLKGKTELRTGDWIDTTADASKNDFIYMDPPYLGTSVGRDKRYYEQLSLENLISGLGNLNSRNIRFALSYDGMTGDKVYGPPLPDNLKLQRVLLNAGRSSQATLSGKNEETIESLYLSVDISDDHSNKRLEVRPKKQLSFL